MKAITIRISDAEHEKLTAQSAAAGVSIAELVRLKLGSFGNGQSLDATMLAEAFLPAISSEVEALQKPLTEAIRASFSLRLDRLEDAFALLVNHVKNERGYNAVIPPEVLKKDPTTAATAGEYLRILTLQHPDWPAEKLKGFVQEHWPKIEANRR